MSAITIARLEQIRNLMKKYGIDYYFVPARDEHNNEYVPTCWQRRTYLSDFNGSAGDALIGLDMAYLWTDPRYFLQAQQQLDPSSFTLMRQQQGIAAPIHQWLAEHAAKKCVGTDPKLISIAEKNIWEKTLQSIGGQLVSLSHNLVDAIWDNQPHHCMNPVFVLDSEHTGLSAKEKLTLLRQILKEQHVEAHALNLLDAIAWLFNIRGSDIDFNPLAISYALITQQHAMLFINETQVSPNLKTLLASQGVTIKPYHSFPDELKQINQPILLEATTATWWMEQQLNTSIIYAPSPISLMKAIKNETEQRGMHEAHRRDGIALCHLFYWLKENWATETEISVADKVFECRSKDPSFKGPSFNTISSYGDHGAIIHYAVNEETNHAIKNDNLFLFDSGGQYLEGTTDVTRVVHLGIPSLKQKLHYTLVLKGHLALRHTVFPHGTCGEQLNAIAHQYLWAHGLDFGHGTGHGVGCYLCVHEGPHRISNAYTQIPIVPGMAVSNEPGIYLEGQYGIRIENVLLTVPKYAIEDSETGHGPFYGFEDLTLYPYELNLIDKNLLTAQEIAWINEYHMLIYTKLHKSLPKEIESWLKQMTEPLVG